MLLKKPKIELPIAEIKKANTAMFENIQRVAQQISYSSKFEKLK